MTTHCPKCNSDNLFRYYDGVKICVQCGCKIKRKSTTPLPRETFKKARIANIKQVHAENPKYTQGQLVAFVPETRYMVIKYWRDPALNTITPNQIKGEPSPTFLHVLLSGLDLLSTPTPHGSSP